MMTPGAFVPEKKNDISVEEQELYRNVEKFFWLPMSYRENRFYFEP